MNSHYAANFASKPGHYAALSGKMCWDAVLYCVSGAGIITASKAKRISHSRSIVTKHDRKVTGAAGMQAVPRGNILGFFDESRLMHVMLCMGFGRASGNKNNCIGLGNPYGWEVLDLARDLRWNGGGGFTAPGMPGPARTLHIHHCPASYMRFK